MTSAILAIVGSILGGLVSWAVWKFLLAPIVQAWQNKQDAAADEEAKKQAAERNQTGNNQDQDDAKRREDIWDGIK